HLRMKAVSRQDATEESQDEQQDGTSQDAARPEPGLVLIFSAGRPAHAPVSLANGPAELGRGDGPLQEVWDPMMSRQHARVTHAGGAFQITDHGSRNGSALDGAPLRGTVTTADARLLRLGHSLFLLSQDLTPFRTYGVTRDGDRVEGPALV